ncbi:polyprenyl synthetase family protein [Streptomyces anulatus]|uniref:polyprenyl synthetase family protein n=1 Tax=Streptomyces anulatus TaxID=1892 RepID=UPI0036750431
MLDVYTGQRVRDARAVDPLFSREVAERVRLFALRGGKRMRARFAWWGWRAGGGSPIGKGAESALRLGAALELIQTCALIHDDVMDGSSLRRGSPALHVEFADDHVRSGMRGDHKAHGRAAAILAGDLALAWADDLVADILTGSANRAHVQRLWRAMRGEMVAGQYLDMRAQADGSSTTDRALRIASLKTALYTVERPLALGAALAGADGRTTSALSSAGRSAGIAFQLYDDLLSVFGDSSVTGKPSGEDIRAGKLTYLTAVARTLSQEAGDASARHVLNRSLGDPSLSVAGLDELRRTLEHTGARRATEREIDRLVSDSQEHLSRAALSASVHGRLSALIGSVVGLPMAYRAPDSDVVR